MVANNAFKQMLQRASLKVRQRGRVVKSFADTIGLVYFGNVDQHGDDHGALRGFTASLTHRDSHFAVGTYNDYDIRLVNRFDVVPVPGGTVRPQVWTIIEITVARRDMPHTFFIPTGAEASEYSRLFATQPQLQPLNTMMGINNHSPEFHGRYQILARPTHGQEVARLFHSPTIVGIGTRFWPQGIEVIHNKLFVYLSHQPTKQHLEMTLGSALWLAETLETTP